MFKLTSDLVFQNARKAYRSWQAIDLPERLKIMKRFRGLVAKDADALVELITSETGKSELDALSGDVFATLEQTAYYEKNAKRFLTSQKITGGGMFYFKNEAKVFYRPYGVVLVLSPFNYPFQLAAIPVISALIAGNSVILKPSEWSPKTGLKILEYFREAGLPTDVLQVVLGDGAIAQELIQKRPDKIFLTGSTRTGQSVLKQTSDLFIPTALELGGKDAMIVCQDARFERALNGMTYGAFLNSGQVCASVKRAFIHESIFDDFKVEFLKRIDSLNPEKDMGQMVRPAECQHVLGMVQSAIDAGAVSLTPVQIQEKQIHPIALINVPANHPICTEELFGPVVILDRFKTDSEVIEKVNAAPQGLTASIWTQDLKRAEKIAEQLIVGSVSINEVIKNVAHPGLPFGGEKSSGWGRSHGEAGLKEFCRTQSVLSTRSKRKKEIHWFPFQDKTVQMLRRWIKFKHSILLLFFTVLNIQISDLPIRQGKMAYAVFENEKGFPKDRSQAVHKGFLLIPTDGPLHFSVPLEHEGPFAVAVYLDANDNQVLDKNFLGIPTESIGFSNDPKILFGPPSFQQAKFKVSPEKHDLEIKMIY